ncbi:alpha/beta hydrolase family esterase [Sinimarinibacterium flocculans]|uniref:alpha/beta hydrolase family esterase n=1 Tax=Sinimarinibacterium flocculans TaxID=985250 RepID=UPI0024936AAC|nr:PHB depolymerase family esterase [Sinimarinibacterium flocculans]
MPGGLRGFVRPALAALVALCALPASALSFLPWENVRITYDTFTYSGDGVTRSVGVMQPQDRGSRTPAIVVLHFNLGSASSMANLTEIGELARDEGVVILLPIADDATWAHNPNEIGASDDAGFLAAMIDEYVARYDLDPARIYMTGYSQGGNMTVRMACEYPGKIAAGASVAATMRKSLARQCAPAVPTPMAFFHGTEDEQVPYGPGVPSLLRDLLGVGALGAQDAAAFWAEINGCEAAATRTTLPAPVDDGTQIQLDSYDNCPDNGGAALYTIVGGGHTWPGVLDFVPVAGITTQNLRANRAMWDFFKRFSR